MKNTFRIPVNDEILLQEIIKLFNQNNRTNIRIAEIIDDEVTFVDIERNGCSDSHLFSVAYYYGIEIHKLAIESGRSF
jgi:hypothetical protein